MSIAGRISNRTFSLLKISCRDTYQFTLLTCYLVCSSRPICLLIIPGSPQLQLQWCFTYRSHLIFSLIFLLWLYSSVPIFSQFNISYFKIVMSEGSILKPWAPNPVHVFFFAYTIKWKFQDHHRYWFIIAQWVNIELNVDRLLAYLLVPKFPSVLASD